MYAVRPFQFLKGEIIMKIGVKEGIKFGIGCMIGKFIMTYVFRVAITATEELKKKETETVENTDK